VFVVAGSGDGFDPAEILFEREGMRRDTAPSRKTRKDLAVFTPGSIGGYRQGFGTLKANGGDLGGGSEHLVAQCFDRQRSDEYGEGNIASTMSARDYKSAADLVAQPYSIMPMNSGKDYKARETDVAQPLMTSQVGGNQGGDYIMHQMAVRRLTPRECERLQGFPDDYTNIP
jgi:DNA (cytosine-5)-methyltransferase 1